MTGSCGLAGISAPPDYLLASLGEGRREGEFRTWRNWEIPPEKPNRPGRQEQDLPGSLRSQGPKWRAGIISPQTLPGTPSTCFSLEVPWAPASAPTIPSPHQPPYCVCELLGAHRGGSHRQVRHAVYVEVQHGHSRAKPT